MSSPGRETPPIPSSPGGAQRPAGRYDPDSGEVSALPWDPVHIKSCVLTPRVESVPLSPVGLHTHAPPALNAKCYRAPPSNARSPGWQTLHVARNSHSSGKTSVIYLLSSLWVTHLAGIWDCLYPESTPPTISMWLLLCLWV